MGDGVCVFLYVYVFFPLLIPAPQFNPSSTRVVFQKGGLPKGWFWRMFPRNEGTFRCSPGAKTGTRVRSHVPPDRKQERGHVLSVAPPAEPRGEKKLFFLCNFWAVQNFLNLLKSAGEIFLSGLRGAKHFFKRVSDRFSDPFSRFSNRFSYRFKNFSGTVSFCKHAALTWHSPKPPLITKPPFCLPVINLNLPQNCGVFGKLPKGPRHTKNSKHSEFTIRSEFTTRSDSLLKM